MLRTLVSTPLVTMPSLLNRHQHFPHRVLHFSGLLTQVLNNFETLLEKCISLPNSLGTNWNVVEISFESNNFYYIFESCVHLKKSSFYFDSFRLGYKGSMLGLALIFSSLPLCPAPTQSVGDLSERTVLASRCKLLDCLQSPNISMTSQQVAVSWRRAVAGDRTIEPSKSEGSTPGGLILSGSKVKVSLLKAVGGYNIYEVWPIVHLINIKNYYGCLLSVVGIASVS